MKQLTGRKHSSQYSPNLKRSQEGLVIEYMMGAMRKETIVENKRKIDNAIPIAPLVSY